LPFMQAQLGAGFAVPIVLMRSAAIPGYPLERGVHDEHQPDFRNFGRSFSGSQPSRYFDDARGIHVILQRQPGYRRRRQLELGFDPRLAGRLLPSEPYELALLPGLPPHRRSYVMLIASVVIGI